jgi:Tfp pilus assembly protein PilV
LFTQSNDKVKRPASANRAEESGFTILETAISLVLMAIVGLGIASLFYYSVQNVDSAGNRELAMAVAQQKMEQLRSVDLADSSLTATTGTTDTVTRSGRPYTISTRIVDSNVVDGQATMKTITVRVTPVNENAAWARNLTSVFGSVTLVVQRSRLVVGPNREF